MDPRLRWLLEKERRRVRALDTSDWGEKLRIIVESCHPRQRAFVTDDSTRVVALVGGRGGKTTGGGARFWRRLLTTPGADCLFIAPTRGQAEQLLWSRLKATNEKLGFGATFSESKLIMTLPRNGAQLSLVGADDKQAIEKLRGIPRHEVGIDEAASYPPKLLESLIDQVLVPRLGDYSGTLWLIGTPGKYQGGHFYDVSRPGNPYARAWDDRDQPDYEGWDGWSLHRWSKKDGAPYVPEIANAWREALREKKRKGWSDEHPVWRREHLGEWASDDTERIYKYRPHLEDGSEWNQWDPEMQKQTIAEGFAKLPKGEWSYVYGCDLGYSDSFAVNVFAYRAHDRTLYHCCCVDRKRMYAQQMAVLLLGQQWVDRIMASKDPGAPGGLVGVTGWPIGAVADNSGKGQAILDELSNVYGFKFKPAERKDKHDSIELSNGDLIDGRVKILKGSKLEEELLDLQWTIDDYGKLTEPRGKSNNNADCLIYARREAHHLLAEDPPAARPAPGSMQHRQQQLDESEERAAREPSEFDEFGNDGFWG